MKKIIAVVVLIIVSISIPMIYAQNNNQAITSEMDDEKNNQVSKSTAYGDKAYQVKKGKIKFIRFLERLRSWGIDVEKISDEDRTLMETLYIESMILEKEIKLEEASIKWDAFGEIYSKYGKLEDIKNIVQIPFKGYFEIQLMYTRSTTERKITEEDLASMERVYLEAVTMDRYNIESGRTWDVLGITIKKYYPELDVRNLEIEMNEDTNLDELPSFKDYIKSITIQSTSLKKITKEDLQFMEKLYNEAIFLGKKYEEHLRTEDTSLWGELANLERKYYPELAATRLQTMPLGKWHEIPSFKEYHKTSLSLDYYKLSKEDYKFAEKLYNETIELVRNEKWKEADDKWHEFQTFQMEKHQQHINYTN